MTQNHEIHIGDRVRVTSVGADGYLQPWRHRFQKGAIGTVRIQNSWGNDVQFDVPKQAKRESDWFLRCIPSKYLEKIGADQ